VFQFGPDRLTMSLTGVGYGPALSAVPAAVPRFSDNRLSYSRGNSLESYVNGPLGVAQSFTLAAPPAGTRTGELTLALAVDGATPVVAQDGKGASFTRDGRTVAGYRGLRVIDAAGSEIPSTPVRGRKHPAGKRPRRHSALPTHHRPLGQTTVLCRSTTSCAFSISLSRKPRGRFSPPTAKRGTTWVARSTMRGRRAAGP
jgi:hypothetical protein